MVRTSPTAPPFSLVTTFKRRVNDYHIKNKNIYYFYIKNYVYHEQINIVKIICNNMEGYTYFTIYKYTLHIYDGLCTRRDVYGTRTVRFNTETEKYIFQTTYKFKGQKTEMFLCSFDPKYLLRILLIRRKN
jgi:hypothetical protein